jgi:ribonuclease P protein component
MQKLISHPVGNEDSISTVKEDCQSFSRANKLVSKKQFDHVFANPKKVHFEGLLFLFKKNEIGSPRLGLTIPKRILGKASQRNYIKRCARETFRRQKNDFLIQGIDIVILPKKDINTITPTCWYEMCARGWLRLAHVLSSYSAAQ